MSDPSQSKTPDPVETASLENGDARRRRWLAEKAAAFAAQAEWHARHGHPLADILASPGRTTWPD
jgi:hypothetical protein